VDVNGVWVGTAVLVPTPENQVRADNYIGAYAGVACRATTIAKAVQLMASEFYENGYALLGFESLLPVGSLDRELTDYERALAEATAVYPVQFRDVHLHKGDA
jgi:hypothetical protein